MVDRNTFRAHAEKKGNIISPRHLITSTTTLKANSNVRFPRREISRPQGILNNHLRKENDIKYIFAKITSMSFYLFCPFEMNHLQSTCVDIFLNDCSPASLHPT